MEHLHLRDIVLDGVDVVPPVHAVLDRMADLCERVRSGTWTGYTGKRIRTVVNVGIGGSDLRPVMAYEALRFYSERGTVFRFVSNVDGTDLVEALRDLEPAETLFVVCSKTFTTLETLTNARAARDWCLQTLRDGRAVACGARGQCRRFARLRPNGRPHRPHSCRGRSAPRGASMESVLQFFLRGLVLMLMRGCR